MMSNLVFFSFLGGPVGAWGPQQLPALLVHKPLLETSASAPARVRARVCSCVCVFVRVCMCAFVHAVCLCVSLRLLGTCTLTNFLSNI